MYVTKYIIVFNRNQFKVIRLRNSSTLSSPVSFTNNSNSLLFVLRRGLWSLPVVVVSLQCEARTRAVGGSPFVSQLN